MFNTAHLNRSVVWGEMTRNKTNWGLFKTGSFYWLDVM